MQDQQLFEWFDNVARPFLAQHAKERLPSFDNDRARLDRILKLPNEVIVCFLGNAGVGKSTLLNALVAGDRQVLPAGGIGPLTAQATEVKYSEEPYFSVRYHGRGRLWRLGFALETTIPRNTAKTAVIHEDFGQLLSLEEQEAELPIESIEGLDAPPADEKRDANLKQAKLLIAGNQFDPRSTEYLADAIRIACGLKPQWGEVITEEDGVRIARLKVAIDASAEKRTLVRRRNDEPALFDRELKDHTAGFLSPLIENIKVGWPSDLLRAGVVLVDLPGVGIAQDTYRKITQEYVQKRARSVILVVDRAGPSEATVEMLRTSGYWSRLVGATDDPEADPCSIQLVVTRVDDVANEEWQSSVVSEAATRPKKRDVYTHLVARMRTQMRNQIVDQLAGLELSDNVAVSDARKAARQTFLDRLEIHPVSAPEFRRLVVGDEDDRSFLQDPAATGIPGLQDSLSSLAKRDQDQRGARATEVRGRLLGSVLKELEVVEARWRRETRAVEEAERLALALEDILGPKRRDYDRRLGAFRNYLQETVTSNIEAFVQQARQVAEADVRRYLERLQKMHWATLRAAVRRGGVYLRGRPIDLPGDISQLFQEPVSAVWSQKLLRDLRAKTSALSADITTLVEELCDWAIKHGGASVSQPLLDNQKALVRSREQQMRQVGQEAVDELRDLVKSRLLQEISTPIRKACEKFVEDGNAVGAGVRDRILQLFRSLAGKATEAAQKPALEILMRHFQVVRKDIQDANEEWGDPLQETADLIIERHEEQQQRADAAVREGILSELEGVTAALAVLD